MQRVRDKQTRTKPKHTDLVILYTCLSLCLLNSNLINKNRVEFSQHFLTSWITRLPLSHEWHHWQFHPPIWQSVSLQHLLDHQVQKTTAQAPLHSLWINLTIDLCVILNWVEQPLYPADPTNKNLWERYHLQTNKRHRTLFIWEFLMWSWREISYSMASVQTTYPDHVESLII